MIDKQIVDQRVYNSAILKNLKDFLTALFGSVATHTYKVRVENTDTNLYKEIAENTRGVKGKLIGLDGSLKKILEKEITVPKSEVTVKMSDVTVSNLSEIKIPQPPKEVRVSNLGEITFPKPEKAQNVDLSPLEQGIRSLESSLKSINEYLPILKPQVFPKIEIPKQVSVKEAEKIIESQEKGVKTLSDDLVALSEVIKSLELGGIATNVHVDNFPPTHIPTPVTNFNINSLKGVPKSTLTLIGTDATPIPTYPLEQRRSLIIFNDSGATVYIGGLNVTTSDGLPILDQSYSPPIDAGQNMIIYGIASSGSNAVRVFEVSNDAEGN
jgi:hypothetical protein